MSSKEQEDIAASVALLEEMGPKLPYPHSSGIQAQSTVPCVSFEFNTKAVRTAFFMRSIPRRVTILLIGGDKTGDDGW